MLVLPDMDHTDRIQPKFIAPQDTGEGRREFEEFQGSGGTT